MHELLEIIAVERRRTANLLERLTPEQWAAQSLCDQWTVRDVAGHLLLGVKVGNKKFGSYMLRARGNFNKANVMVARELGQAPTDQLVADLREHATHPFRPVGMDFTAPLTDVVVHTQDIAIPLGIPHPVAPEHLRPVMDGLTDFKAAAIVPRKRVKGMRFEATDFDWSLGSGEPVRGPGLAILMAIFRGVRLDDLEGEGVARLEAAVT